MAPTFTYDELAANISTGTEDGMRNVVNTAADFVCDLWQNYSEFSSGFGDPTGVGKFNNALFSRLCEPRDKRPPNPPFAQFTGGQCAKAYRLTGTYRYGPNAQTSSFIFNNAVGPIKGLKVVPTATPRRSKYGIAFTPSINWPDGFAPFIEGGDDSVRPVELLSLIATPLVGTDDCGDPPPTYPPKAPGPNDVKKNVNVNVGAGVVVFAPVTLIPTRFDIDAEINPQINVSVGPFNVTFDAGGITVSPNFNFGNQPKTLPSADESPGDVLPPQPPRKGTDCPDVKVDPTDLTPVITRLEALQELVEDIEECACPVGYTRAVSGAGFGNSGEIVLPKNTIEVLLSLVDVPDNAKTQSGGDNAPLQYFCGYYAFGDGSAYGSRQPINTANSMFEVPVWATSFYWSLYTAYTANVSIVTLTPEKDGAELVVRQMKMPPE